MVKNGQKIDLKQRFSIKNRFLPGRFRSDPNRPNRPPAAARGLTAGQTIAFYHFDRPPAAAARGLTAGLPWFFIMAIGHGQTYKIYNPRGWGGGRCDPLRFSRIKKWSL